MRFRAPVLAAALVSLVALAVFPSASSPVPASLVSAEVSASPEPPALPLTQVYAATDFGPEEISEVSTNAAKSRLARVVAAPINKDSLRVTGRVLASGKKFPLTVSIDATPSLPSPAPVRVKPNKRTGQFGVTVPVPAEFRQLYEDGGLTLTVSGTALRKSGAKDRMSVRVSSESYLGVDPSPITPVGPGTWSFTPPDAPPLAGSSESFTYISTLPDGTPRRWNPCKPVPYTITVNGASQQAVDTLTAALANITESTGQAFEFKGNSDVIPLAPNTNFPVGVLAIGFANEAQVPYLAGSVAGAAGSSASSANPARFVSGVAVFDVESYSYLNMSSSPGMTQIFLHEIGHALGLDHVNDATQVMYPSNTRDKDRYQAGDRNGLIQLNLRGCMN